MKRFLIFTLLAICLMGCAEENDTLMTENDTLMTNEETVEIVPDNVPVVNLVLAEVTCPAPNNDWELLATLERNPLRPSGFYVPHGEVEHLPDLTDTLNGAFAEGKHFIFVIKERFVINQRQFYLLQPEPPVFERRPGPRPPGHVDFEIFQWQFPSEPTWYRSTHFGLGKTTTDTTYAGLSVAFDLTPDLNDPPKRKYWQPPKFFVSINHVDTNFVIDDDTQLQIYVSR